MAPLTHIPSGEEIEALIGSGAYQGWTRLCTAIDSRYELGKQWNSGGKKWLYEYKYRRGGKTLCALYAKEGGSGFMVILGQAERDKFDAQRQADFPGLGAYYDQATTYHDGKWLLFPLDQPELLPEFLRLLAIKRKPRL